MFWSGIKVEKPHDAKERDNLETSKKIISYKRKGMDKTQQGFEYSDVKFDSDTEKMVTTPKTPGFLEYILVEKSMEIGVPDPKSPKVKKTYSRLKNVEAIKSQPKTRPSNKFHLNMKIMIIRLL